MNLHQITTPTPDLKPEIGRRIRLHATNPFDRIYWDQTGTIRGPHTEDMWELFMENTGEFLYAYADEFDVIE